MGDHTAFFYGLMPTRVASTANLICRHIDGPEVLHRVCYGPGAVGNDPAKTFLASQLLVQPAILHDYCRHRVRGCDYPGIVPETGHTVRGTFVTGLTDGDIFRLDAFEGNEYERIKVKVELVEVSGRFVEASTYMYAAGEECLEKKEWSYEEFRRDKIHRWADDSNEYQQVDDAVEGDPTGGRHIKTDIHASTYTKLAEDKKALNAAV